MVAAAVSLFVLIHPPGPHLPALTFVLLFPSSFGLRSRSLICVLVPIHLCLLGCLPIQPPCGLHLHSFDLRPCLLICVLVPICLCQPLHSRSCSCLHLSFVHAHLCPLAPLICVCSHLCLAFICAHLHPLICACSHLRLAFTWARSCPLASHLCLYQIHN